MVHDHHPDRAADDEYSHYDDGKDDDDDGEDEDDVE